MAQSFNEWVALREGKQSTIWERYGEKLPSLFRRTYYALPTEHQLEEFQQYPNLTAEDLVQGFGYTIVGRGINSPQNQQKIIDSIQMLINRYPENKTYKEALTLVMKESKPWLDWSVRPAHPGTQINLG